VGGGVAAVDKSKQQTIRGKFLRVTIPLIFLTVIGVFSVVELMNHKNAIDQLHETLAGMITTQSAALATPVWNLDREQIQLSLEAVVTNREIVAARIYGEDTTLMLEVVDQAASGDHMILRRDIIYDADSGPKIIGQLEFVATRQSVWERTRLRLFIAAGIALLAVAMEVAAALFALRRIIGSPLEKLLSSINRVRSGAGREQVDWPSTDELGQVISAFNEMQLQQEAYERELREGRDTLEARVAERTTALEQLSNQLAKYLSPQVYESIFRGKHEVKIASERKKLTVFFSDIADFTGTTDSLEPEELTNLLNHYLTEMSKIALDYGATIDKYVGDAIIAFFGDPETRGVKEDARTCVNMAIAMQRRMRELRSEWLGLGLERPFELRIGINTGFCTVGNFGSEDRMDYTIIGNEVNLAARLESHAEVGGILMAHETHALVKDTVMAEEGDALTVKGFAKPVRTYSVVGLYDDLAEQGRIIRKEQDGVRILLDLDKQDRASAIEAVEDVLSQLKG
jgi:class 3 adenylate cyclase